MESDKINLGVSCIICCHNSAGRIKEVLYFLAKQKELGNIRWEIIIVDNASTDNTASIALEDWKGIDHPTSLRIVREGRLGIGYARYTGIKEAAYEFIGFIDDDNYVNENWVSRAYHVMAGNPDIGACGSLNEAITDGDLPWWFDNFKRSYATGPQSDIIGDVTENKGVLWSAGMVLRKKAINDLFAGGFSPIVTGALGTKNLYRGEDYELCFALRLGGWRLWYEPELKLRHYLPQQRLKWKYLRKLLRGVGKSSVGFDPYYYELDLRKHPGKRKISLKFIWIYQLLSTSAAILSRWKKLYHLRKSPLEGDYDVLLLERLIGRLESLIEFRKYYRSNFEKIHKVLGLPHGCLHE